MEISEYSTDDLKKELKSRGFTVVTSSPRKRPEPQWYELKGTVISISKKWYSWSKWLFTIETDSDLLKPSDRVLEVPLIQNMFKVREVPEIGDTVFVRCRKSKSSKEIDIRRAKIFKVVKTGH